MQQFDGSRDMLDPADQEFFADQIQDLWISICKNHQEIIQELKETFSKEEEFGLLNRLDTDTSGLLYFAKNKEVYDSWKQLQSDGKIEKYYLAKTDWSLSPQVINNPLAHHKNWKRMIVIDDAFLASKRKQKMKGQLLEATTTLLDNSWEYTHIMIQKWRRHQIRAHLAYIWAPIVGEKIYTEPKTSPLQLFSIGCTIYQD